MQVGFSINICLNCTVFVLDKILELQKRSGAMHIKLNKLSLGMAMSDFFIKKIYFIYF